jgi:hypothetical protein
MGLMRGTTRDAAASTAMTAALVRQVHLIALRLTASMLIAPPPSPFARTYIRVVHVWPTWHNSARQVLTPLTAARTSERSPFPTTIDAPRGADVYLGATMIT